MGEIKSSEFQVVGSNVWANAMLMSGFLDEPDKEGFKQSCKHEHTEWRLPDDQGDSARHEAVRVNTDAFDLTNN